MGKLRKILIGILAVCMTVCAGLALSACEDDYPNYKNPTGGTILPGEEQNDENRYTIKVRSLGGLGLSNVEVNLLKNGERAVGGISRNGEMVLYTSPDDYEIQIVESSLPEGYRLPDSKYTTGTSKEIVINIPSGVISSTASSDKVYKLGDIAHEFSVTDVKDEKYLLTELIGQYKAVVLNFFFTSCGPCNVEFPALNEAYEAFSDRIAVVALADPSKDSATAVKNYAAQKGFSFIMGRDEGLISKFSVTGFPTTVIIDRYGVVAYWDAGAQTSAEVWKSLFARFTSDNYVQDITPPDEDPDEEVKENIKPPADLAHPNYDLMPSQIAPDATNKVVKFETETSDKDKVYNWPWVVENDEDYTYMTASNSGQDPSYSIIYLTLDLDFGDMVSFDYNLKSLDSYDRFIVIADSSTPLLQISGDSKGWQKQENIYIANKAGPVTLSFTYIKYYDSKKNPVDGDFVKVKNISVVNAKDTGKAIDVAHSVFHEGLTVDNVVLNPDDGYYHIANTGNPEFDGALLLIELQDQTPWSFEHTGSYSFSPEDEEGSYYSCVYWISYFLMSNRKTKEDNETIAYTYLSKKDTDYLNDMLDLQKFSDNLLLPVTERLKNIIVAFMREFNKSYVCQKESEDGDWVEMCYFFQHYNSENYEHWETVKDEDGNEQQVKKPCFVHDDPIKGMFFMNAFTAVQTDDPENPFPNHVNIEKTNMGTGGGIFYKFTVPQTGVYELRSRYDVKTETDPQVILYRPDGNGDYEDFAIIDDNFSYDAMEKSEIVATPKDNGYELSYNHYEELANFYGFVTLEKGETIYLQLRQFMSGAEGKYDFSIKYMGESYDWLRVCSISGSFVGITDENDQIIDYVYDAIPVAYDSYSDCFYAHENNEFGSPIYIDFVNANYFHIMGHSLKKMIDDGLFNLRPFGQRDYTDKIKEYYNRSIEGKSEGEELYGMTEASWDLVQIISDVLYWRGDKDGYDKNYWLSVATYYQHFGI